MRRQFQESSNEELDQVRTRHANAFTDDELSRRFSDKDDSGTGPLMDEEAVRRMMKLEREAEKAAKIMADTDTKSSEDGMRFLRSKSRSRSPSHKRRKASSTANADPSRDFGADDDRSLRPGVHAKLTGLKAAAHLNEQTGVLQRFDADAGRWEVRLSSGDVKAIKADNLSWVSSPSESQAAEPAVAPPSPDVDVAPKSPPLGFSPSMPVKVTPLSRQPSGAGEIGGLSSGALAGGPPLTSPSGSKPPATPVAPQKIRRFGTIRWYNGRRKLGYIIPEGGGADLFIPAQGASNGSLVPPQPGGLMHGTRVSYVPMTLETNSAFSTADPKAGQQIVCMEVKPQAGQVGLSAGVDSNNGAKETNDDRVAAADLSELGFIAGVFDGHRGSACSDYVASRVPNAIKQSYRAKVKRACGGNMVKLSHSQEAELISAAIIEAFETVDQAYVSAARKQHWLGGSTGLVCLVTHGFEVPVNKAPASGCSSLWPKPKEPAAPEKIPGTVPTAPGGVAKLFVGWCGDSRALLLRGRQALRVSEDHRPCRPDEQKRIKSVGGVVMKDGRGVWRCGPRPDNKLVAELAKKKRDFSNMWFLSTSRSFGDVELKQPDPVLTATPEVKVLDLQPEDWAIVLGSDGIFDKLTDQGVADTVWKSMAGDGHDAVRAAKDVVQAALRSGSRDNLTAVIMRLGWASPPPSVAQNMASSAADDECSMFGSTAPSKTMPSNVVTLDD